MLGSLLVCPKVVSAILSDFLRGLSDRGLARAGGGGSGWRGLAVAGAIANGSQLWCDGWPGDGGERWRPIANGSQLL